MKIECLWGVVIKFKIFMRKVKSPLKQTNPLQICGAHSLIHRSVLLLFSIALKVVILVCGSLFLPEKDEEIIHQTIHRTFEETAKGFIAWLKNGRLTVDPDVLAQFLSPGLARSFEMPPSSPGGVAQGQSNVPLHSSDRRRHFEQLPERNPGYGWKNENLHQQRVSFPAATPAYNTEQNRMIGKLVLKSKLRYGNISLESADLEFLSHEFCEIADETAQVLLKTYKYIDEIQLKIMSIASHKSQIVYVGDQGIEMADNDLLLLKTCVINGMVSFDEDDIEVRYLADWQVPVYILEDLDKKKSNGKLFIISDEKGNLKCHIKSEKQGIVAETKNKALALFTSITSTKESASKSKYV